jgi:hypothetical protein
MGQTARSCPRLAATGAKKVIFAAIRADPGAGSFSIVKVYESAQFATSHKVNASYLFAHRLFVVFYNHERVLMATEFCVVQKRTRANSDGKQPAICNARNRPL